MEEVKYDLADNLKIAVFYTDLGIRFYLTDQDGKQIGRVVPADGSDPQSFIREVKDGNSE